MADASPPEPGDPDALAARIERLRAKQTPEAETPSSGLSTLYLFFSLGTSFVGCLVAGFFAGRWYDGHYGTHLGIVVGVLLGLVTGVIGAYRLLKPFLQP